MANTYSFLIGMLIGVYMVGVVVSFITAYLSHWFSEIQCNIKNPLWKKMAVPFLCLIWPITEGLCGLYLISQKLKTKFIKTKF